MTKQNIINKLLIVHDVWECGYTRSQLERMEKSQLLKWLERLEEYK